MLWSLSCLLLLLISFLPFHLKSFCFFYILCRFAHPDFNTTTMLFTPTMGATDQELLFRFFQSDIMAHGVEAALSSKSVPYPAEITPNIIASVYTAIFIINKGPTVPFSNEKKQESFKIFQELYVFLNTAANRATGGAWQKILEFYHTKLDIWSSDSQAKTNSISVLGLPAGF